MSTEAAEDSLLLLGLLVLHRFELRDVEVVAHLPPWVASVNGRSTMHFQF